jgi:hypothetical protein
MADIIELRNAAEKLRLWAKEVRSENMPAPYAGADEDMSTLERVATLLDEAANEIIRLRASTNNE